MEIIVKCPLYKNKPTCDTAHLCPIVNPPKFVVGYLGRGRKDKCVIDEVGAIAISNIPNERLDKLFYKRKHFVLARIVKNIRKLSPKGHCYSVYIVKVIAFGDDVYNVINGLKEDEVIVQGNIGYCRRKILSLLKR